jgi:hypothetical protein
MVHSRTETVHDDISNCNLILGMNEKDQKIDCTVQTPTQTVKNVIDLYCNLLKTNKFDANDSVELRKQVKGLMRKYENFVVFDVPPKEENVEKKEYAILCALLFEREVYVDNVKSSIIHLMGAKKGCES